MKWKDILCSLIGSINIANMSILSKAIYRFNMIPIKIPMTFFAEVGKIKPKIYMGPQKTLRAKTIPRKNEAEGMKIPSFKLYYKMIVIKTV